MQPDPNQLVFVVQLICAMVLGWILALLAVARYVWPAPKPDDLHVPTINTCRKVSVLLYLAAQEMAEAERQLTLHLRGQGGEESLEDAQQRVRNAKTDLASAEALLKR